MIDSKPSCAYCRNFTLCTIICNNCDKAFLVYCSPSMMFLVRSGCNMVEIYFYIIMISWCEQQSLPQMTLKKQERSTIWSVCFRTWFLIGIIFHLLSFFFSTYMGGYWVASMPTKDNMHINKTGRFLSN